MQKKKMQEERIRLRWPAPQWNHFGRRISEWRANRQDALLTVLEAGRYLCDHHIAVFDVRATGQFSDGPRF
jgi:hypothetical protein